MRIEFFNRLIGRKYSNTRATQKVRISRIAFGIISLHAIPGGSVQYGFKIMRVTLELISGVCRDGLPTMTRAVKMA